MEIEVHEQGHNSRGSSYVTERQKSIEKELYCEIIRINPAKENFNIFVEIARIHSFIAMSLKNPTKKTLVDDLSNKLLELENQFKAS